MKRALLAALLLSGSVVPPPPAPVTPIAARLPDVTGANVAAVVYASPSITGSSRGGGSKPETAASSPAPTGGIGSVLIGGVISYVGPRFGPSYLALPFPRGTVAQVCGPLGCITRRSTDFGPDQRVHPNRIADVSASDFTAICGPLSIGLCRGSVELDPPVHPDDDAMRAEDGPKPTVPPTSTEAVQ